MTQYNTMQIIKRRFFAMRNGIIADALRKGGCDYRMIFGLNLPQIAEIAADLPHTPELAAELWADRRTRESMLLAPMLQPVDGLDADTAMRMLDEAPTGEVADVLCMKLLRMHPSALSIALGAIGSEREMTRYGALRLMMNLLILAGSGKVALQPLAEVVRPCAEAEIKGGSPLTSRLAMQIIDELDFMLEGDTDENA